MDSLGVLKASCFMYPSKRVNQVLYKSLDSLHIKPVNTADSRKTVRIKEVLGRIYNSSPRDVKSFIHWLPKHFKDKDLDAFLGEKT